MPSKKSGTVSAKWSNLGPARWRSLPARRRKTIMALAGVCAAGVVIMVGQPAAPADTMPKVSSPSMEMPANKPVMTEPAPRPSELRRQSRAPLASTARPVNAVASTSARTERARPVATSATSAGSVAAEVSAVSAAAQGGEAATITGCLEADGDTFRLKDAEGENAPKARSWKSGFLRRSNAQVEVVDVNNRLRLASHVGHRVTVAGMLFDREIEARSMRMLAQTCED